MVKCSLNRRTRAEESSDPAEIRVPIGFSSSQYYVSTYGFPRGSCAQLCSNSLIHTLKPASLSGKIARPPARPPARGLLFKMRQCHSAIYAAYRKGSRDYAAILGILRHLAFAPKEENQTISQIVMTVLIFDPLHKNIYNCDALSKNAIA